MDIIICPSNLHPTKPWALLLRQHDLSGTDYTTIAYVTEEMAGHIVAAGPAFWLFDDPREVTHDHR